ncbi:helix-turn-helix domain-containing protein [Piscirickettsia salmonis]|uniref:helix-turn-helix domain-containing protein n=1 Tax=Piscirickettsia salmonis TaxID=1238 RepID=UPI0007C893C3|nr:putative HTH-type transcriptional regulator [Piscirickettsiaceae bacterium NZ-RLO1]
MNQESTVKDHKNCIPLKILMDKNSVSVQELSNNTGLTRPTINSILKGTSNPTLTSLTAISQYFGITIGQLLGEETISEGLNSLEQNESFWISYPVYQWQEVYTVIKSNQEIQVSNIIKSDIDISKSSFAVVMNDSSMEPFISKGSTLIFDPKRKPYDSAFIIAYIHKENDIVFKQLHINKPHQFLTSTNNKIPSENIKLSDSDEIIAVLAEMKKII